VRKLEGLSKFFGGLLYNIESKTIKLTTTLALDVMIEGVTSLSDQSY